jgi:transcriptional regulator with XRE-family HTH domain
MKRKEKTMQEKIVAENIKRHREARSWTQEHLAQAARVDVRTIQRAEAGNGLGSESLLAVAGAFGVDVEILKRDPGAEELEKLARRFDLLRLERIDQGAQLGRLLRAMISFEVTVDLDSERADAVAIFYEELTDWNDIWGDLGPVQRRDGEKSLETRHQSAQTNRARHYGDESSGKIQVLRRRDAVQRAHFVHFDLDRAKSAHVRAMG